MAKIKKDSLGDRMKLYESVSKTTLLRRTPVILRLDGCHFHSTVSGFIKPFDPVLIKTMQDTMLYLCKHIQGCVLGYTQSDEITLVLVDYKNVNSSAWFDNEVQKMCSVAASMASMVFNQYFTANRVICSNEVYEAVQDTEKLKSVLNAYSNVSEKGAYFDCRVFNVPKSDVANNLIWRQKDATRNSIQSLARAYFSHNELQNLSCNELQEKLFTEKGINWNNLETTKKRGSACIKETQLVTDEDGNQIERSIWVIDNEIPIFTEDRDYIEKLIFI